MKKEQMQNLLRRLSLQICEEINSETIDKDHLANHLSGLEMVCFILRDDLLDGEQKDASFTRFK